VAAIQVAMLTRTKFGYESHPLFRTELAGLDAATLSANLAIRREISRPSTPFDRTSGLAISTAQPPLASKSS
jgi:hypothetical protein